MSVLALASSISAEQAYEDKGYFVVSSTSSVTIASTTTATATSASKPTGAHDVMYCDEMYHTYLDEKKNKSQTSAATVTASMTASPSASSKASNEPKKDENTEYLSAGSSLIMSAGATGMALFVAVGLLV